MQLWRMKGAWNPLYAGLYEAVVAAGMGPLYRRFVDQAFEAPLPRGTRLLDLGCGQGQVTRLLAQQHPGCTALGLDLSAEMIRRARKVRPALVNLSFRQGDALDLPLADQSMDQVVCVASIKHWPHRLAGLQEVHRVLAPDGALTILEADAACTSAQARRFVSHWRHVLPGARGLLALHFRKVIAGQALARDELHQLLQRAGFAQVETRQQQDLPFVVGRAQVS